MKEFASLPEFITFLKGVSVKMQAKTQEMLEFDAQYLEDKAKEKFGILQKAAGPFDKWEELADSTKAQKDRSGYVFNSDYNPLLNSGGLKESIEHIVGLNRFVVGSESDVMVWQELGTHLDGYEHIPPRSVLGATMYENLPFLKKSLDQLVKSWFQAKPFDKSAIKR